MAGDEDLPATLTPVEGTGTSQGSSQGLQRPWGRLISYKIYLPNIDLADPKFSFGRSEGCSLVLTKRMLSGKEVKMIDSISKVHFEIFKNPQDNLIYIKDLSKNGTFLNGKRIGKGNRRILKTGDEIYLYQPPKKLYLFQRTDGGVDNLLPIELNGKFAYVKQIGRGAAGEVYLAKDRETCEPLAIKKIVKSERNTSQMYKINHPTKISNEINILRTLSHPSVIHMKGMLEQEDIVYIILEFMEGGDLYQRITSIDLPEDIVKFYFYQMSLGVRFLHQHGISHRDLKPENILLMSNDLETIVKITDFGLSKNAEVDDLKTMCGTYKYVAPEVICPALRDYGEYGKEVDVWSLGVMLFFMLSRTLPFDSPEIAVLKKRIVCAQYEFEEEHWSDISREAKDLVRRMLVQYPKRRIRIEDILKHPWITGDHPMRHRVHNLIKQHEGHLPVDFESQEPPEKKFKFTVFTTSTSSGSDSGDSDVTRRCYDSFSVSDGLIC